MAPLVEQLRRARNGAGLSLEEISARTKIRLSVLEAIERGDFERVPGGLFVRGFLRAYAREVGLDPEAVVASYLEQYEPAPPPVDNDTPAETNRVQDVILAHPSQDFSWRKLWPTAALGAALVALIMFTASRTPAPRPAEENVVGTGGEAAAMPETPPARAAQETLTLDVQATRDVWLAATADGRRAVYRVLRSGERATITARDEISARVGDAGAIAYTLNGVAGQPLGASGEVLDVLITPGSLRVFDTERPRAQTPKS